MNSSVGSTALAERDGPSASELRKLSGNSTICPWILLVSASTSGSEIYRPLDWTLEDGRGSGMGIALTAEALVGLDGAVKVSLEEVELKLLLDAVASTTFKPALLFVIDALAPPFSGGRGPIEALALSPWANCHSVLHVSKDFIPSRTA